MNLFYFFGFLYLNDICLLLIWLFRYLIELVINEYCFNLEDWRDNLMQLTDL